MANPFLQDLSAALVLSFGHFLWIGTLIATITAVAAHRQRTSAGRYQAWLAGFVAMAMTPVITLLVLRSISSPAPDVVSPDKQPRPGIVTLANADPVAAMDPVDEQSDAPLEPATSVLKPASPVAAPPETSRSAGPRSEASWWRVYAPLVTDLYLIGVSLMGLRLLLGLWGGRRLQRRAIPVTDATLLQSLQRQATTIGMKYVPILAYCERVAVPTVLGILKPTILLPISVLSGLTADQIESVLAHELAHLRRHDHIVNLIQRVVESLLFFHPAIWWVSRCIREEREHCCDDLVIACGAVPLDYAQSLLRVAELSRATESARGNHRRSFSAVSLLATGDRPSTLRQRVGRMLGYQTDMNVRAVHPWTLFCLSLFSVGAVWVLTSMTWVALAEIHRDHSQTTVIVGWSAIVDESVLREIRALKGTATEYSATAQGLQCSADELRLILSRHLDNKRLVIPERAINHMLSSGGWGRHSEYIQMFGSGSVPIDNRIGSVVEATWHATGQSTRIDVPDGVKVRFEGKYFYGLTGNNPIESPVEFESELRDGQAAIVVLGPSQVTADSVRDEPQGRKLATVEVSLAAIFVHEAVRIPNEQVALLKSLTDTDGWIRRDSTDTKVHVRRILDWRQQPGTDVFAKNPAWTHEMPDGGQIQLVGLSRPKTAPLIWWTPEGRPLTGVGDRAGQFDGDFCALVRISEAGKSRGIRQHPRSVTSDGVLNVEPRLMGGGDSQFVVVPVIVNPDTDETKIEVGAGFGAWDAETTIGPETGSSARLNGVRFETVQAGTWPSRGRIPAKTNTLFAWNRTPDREVTALAQTTSGGLFEADSPPLVITKRHGEVDFLGSPAVSHWLPKDEIQQFVLKSRPVHWTSFTGFSAEPVGLNPPLVMAKLHGPGEAAVPPANEEPAFVATPSHGITVKLVGVGFHPSGSREWWQPDGSNLEVRPYEKLGAHVLSDDSERGDCREFALQFSGLPQGATVNTRFGRSVSMATTSSFKEGKGSRNIAAGPFENDKTTSLIVGIASGPFGPVQQIGVDGNKPASADIPKELKLFYDQIRPLRVDSLEGTIELVFQSLGDVRDKADWQLVAIDTDGNQVQSTSSGGTEKEFHFGFKLPLERLDHFEHQLRPIRQVTFENISLVPGEKSDVKVITEKPAKAVRLVGKIVVVDSVKKLVEISLGQADGVKVRDRLDVYDEKIANDPQRRPKGQIEVIRITPDGAVARILHEPLNDPVTKSNDVMFVEPAPATAKEDNDNGAAKVDTAKMSTVELAQRAVRQMERRRLTVGRHSPAQVMQGLKAFGLNYQVKSAADPNELSPAWDWISKGTMPPNPDRLWVIRGGIAQGHPFTRPSEFEGHPGQFVAWLGAAGVSLDAQVIAIDEQGNEERITVQRLVDDLRKLRLELQRIGGQRVVFETDWQLWALAHYSAPATIWDMTRPKGQGIVELIERQLDGHDLALPHDGAIGRLGLAIARAKSSQLDPKSKKDASALLARVDNRLDKAITAARSHQSADGWIYRVDLPQEHREIVRLQFTGCELAWLSQALSSEELVRESWINNAARRVALELLESQKTFNVQEMTDAVLGLRMYLAKVAPGSVAPNGGQEHNDSSPSSKAATVLQTTPKSQDPRVPSKVDTETVVGKVVSPDGKPVPGIEVLVFQGGLLVDKFTTDERGEVRVPQAWRDVDHWLTAVARDRHDRLGWFDFMVHGHSDKGQKTEDGSFRLVLLPLNRTVRGRVVDESGMPLAQIPVQMTQLDQDVNLTAVHWRHQKLGNEPLVRGAITDNDGRFELKLPAETSGWLSTNHPDWVDARIRAADDQSDLGETKLVRAAKVTGRVLDSRTGSPLAGVTVGAFAKQTEFLQSSGDEATTDAHGMYVIPGLRPVEYAIQLVKGFDPILTAPAYATADLKSGESFLADFALTVGKRVTGRVLDMTTGEPIPKCRVACTGPSCPAVRLETETNERGEFEFRVYPGINVLDCRQNRIFGAESTRAVTVPVDSDPDPVMLKVGPATPSDPGQKVKIFMGRPVDRKVTVNFQQKSLAEALEAVCSEAGLKLELDEDGLTSVDVSKDKPVTLVESKRVPLQRALTLILAPHEKLSFLVGKFRVYVSGHEQVNARQRLLESGDLPPEVPAF